MIQLVLSIKNLRNVQCTKHLKRYEEAMEGMEFSVALSSVWEIINRTNKYMMRQEP